MKVKFTWVALVVFCFTDINGQGIQFFDGTYEEALAKAKEEEKILFIDAYAKWCGPCKRMAKTVFTQTEVGNYFNEHFINLKLDMEEQDGLKFGRKNPVKAFPTLFFMDGDGKVLNKVKGAQQVEGLLKLGKLALLKHDKSAHYAELYEDGDRSFKTVYNYIRALNMAGKPSLKISNEFLNSKPDISAKEIALFTFEAAVEADSRIFDLMLGEKELILEEVGEEKYRQKVVAACSATMNKAIEYNMELLREETHGKCKEALEKKTAELEILKMDLAYFNQLDNLEAYLKTADGIAKKFAKKDINLYRYLIEDIDKNYKSSDKAIDKGVKYGKELFKKEESADNAVLYVRMLIEAKEISTALNVIDKTIEKIGEETSDGQKLSSIRRYVESLEES